MALIAGFFLNDLNLLALTFFFLALSAVELGAGLVLLLIQQLVTRSTGLTNNTRAFSKHNVRSNALTFFTKVK
jgi:hypothetical protein